MDRGRRLRPPSKMRQLGYIPDPVDGRDFPAEERLGALTPPPSASLRSLVVEVLDQTNQDCVANAGFQAVRMRQLAQQVNAPAPPLGSRRFGYYFSRKIDGAEARDEGTYIRSFFKALTKLGFPPESAWAYDHPFDRMPATAAVRSAFDQKTTAYRRIFSMESARIVDIKRAIAAGYPVVFGTDVSVEFASNDLGEGPLAPPIGARIAGGHAMTAVGYNGDAFEVVNSWGTGWGASGYCTFSADYLAWPGTRDLWIVEAPPAFSE